MNLRPWTYVFAFIVAGFLVYHFTYPKSLPQPQGFKDKVVLDTSKDTTMFPYTTTPINSLDQYELEAVFDNEGDRQLKKQQINQMTRRYPLDWTNYPPNASKFQSEQAKYIESFSTQSSADALSEPYKNIGDSNLRPPDTLEMERREKEILTTYVPKKANDLSTYDADDAQALMEKIYKAKGVEPTVIRKEGNVFEVVSTRQINREIQYEDELPEASYKGSSNPNMAAGEAVIRVPPVATETAAGLDPFYEPTTATRSDRTDYMQWTPGLERMFAPTYPVTDWVGQPK
jgi:hypothetical protein